MRFDTLQGWLSWIESCHPSEIDLGLERMGQVFNRLNCDFTQTKVITVAGTNGKGSCVAVLEHLLCAAGLRVGCYTSPHFLRYNERIRINANDIDDQRLVDAFAIVDQLRGDTSLTYFEYGTLAALNIFSSLQLDVVIMEVGLGGRLDASNIVDADIGIVTNIDIDHVDWLGSDIEVIGREKSGIFRQGKIAICGDPSPPATVELTAQELGATFYQRDEHFSGLLTKAGFDWRGVDAQQQAVTLSGLPRVNLPFDSVVAAIQACHLLGKSLDPSIYQTLSQLQLTGRFQQVTYQGRQLIFDVAHNPAAAEYLSVRLSESKAGGDDYALVAMMADKDVEAILAPLTESFKAWFLADLTDNSRALKAVELASRLQCVDDVKADLSDSMAEALTKALSVMGDGDRLIVFGSFFTVAELLNLIDDPSNSNNKQLGDS